MRRTVPLTLRRFAASSTLRSTAASPWAASGDHLFATSPTLLLIGNCRARRTNERDDFRCGKSCVTASSTELGTRVVEAAFRFDEHVQRHQQSESVTAAVVVDHVFDAMNTPPGASASNALPINMRFCSAFQSCKRLLDARGQARIVDGFLRDRLDGRQIECRASQARMSPGNVDCECATCAADVAKRAVLRKIEPLG
jgi:hypothetical protein